MQQNYAECLRRVLLSEGGYTNDPRDPGGPTNWGITLADARVHWKPDATAEDVRNMPRSVAEAIYKAEYWDALSCDALPSGEDYAVFDYAVNSGVGRAGRVLRATIGLPTNTWRVDVTVLARLSNPRVDPVRVVDAICGERLRFLHALPTWPAFGGGWGRRVASVKAYSEHLANAAPHVVAPPHPENLDVTGKAYAADDHPIEAELVYSPSPLGGYSSPNAPQEAIVAPQNSTLVSYPDLPATPVTLDQTPTQRPSNGPAPMVASKTGWAAWIAGGSGAYLGLDQVNSYASQLATAKDSLANLHIGGLLTWGMANPVSLLPILIVAGAVFIWEDHRKYKRLLFEASRKAGTS